MKKDILQLPFDLLAEGVDLKEFVDEYQPQSWWLPQIVAFFGNMEAKENSAGKLCIKSTLVEGFSSFTENAPSNIHDPKLWYKGIVDTAKTTQRSKMLPGRAYESPRYSQLVPLILSGFKQNQNIRYTGWDKETLRFGVDEGLADAMLFSEKIDLPEGEGYFDLVKRLCTKSGKVLPFDSCASLSHYKGTVLENVPRLVRTMVTQTWLAHASHRDTTYMVLDHLNWDSAPEIKVSGDVLARKAAGTKKREKNKIDDSDLPWMN